MNPSQAKSPLALQEQHLRHDRAFSGLADSHVHRCVRETSLGFLIGRDAILADWVGHDQQVVTIEADFGDMIAFSVRQDDQVWAGHRWVERQTDNIMRETLIETGGGGRLAPDMHPPLGELRAGRGQYDAGTRAILPADFSEGALPLANMLHQSWNGRGFDLYNAPWLLKLVRALPDATFYFERALVAGDRVAILWRVHGHHAGGQRIRLIGSSVMTFEAGAITSDNSVVDFDAMDAQLQRGLIDYS